MTDLDPDPETAAVDSDSDLLGERKPVETFAIDKFFVAAAAVAKSFHHYH